MKKISTARNWRSLAEFRPAPAAWPPSTPAQAAALGAWTPPACRLADAQDEHRRGEVSGQRMGGGESGIAPGFSADCIRRRSSSPRRPAMPAPPCADPRLCRSRSRSRAPYIVGRPLLPRRRPPRRTHYRGRQACGPPHSARLRPRRGKDGGDFRRAPTTGRPPLPPRRPAAPCTPLPKYPAPRASPTAATCTTFVASIAGAPLVFPFAGVPYSSTTAVAACTEEDDRPCSGLGWAKEVRGRV
jgi:hypothetical protein